MIDHDKLFAGIRKFAGQLSQQQVDSVNAILNSCTRHDVTDPRQIDYIISTAYHESGLKPIGEYGKGKGRPYGVVDAQTGKTYYGRGFVQLTWKGNYQAFGKLLKIDLVNRPELALQTDYAAEIIVVGMRDGMFTGRKLSQYFNDTKSDPIWARSIVNGKRPGEELPDKAALIASYFYKLQIA